MVTKAELGLDVIVLLSEAPATQYSTEQIENESTQVILKNDLPYCLDVQIIDLSSLLLLV